MRRPLLDILLAVHNGGRYLRPLLDSLLAQTFQDFRLVVSNNRSSDDTGAILDSYRGKFSDRFLILPLPETHIASHANFARVTDAGNASYVMYADGDDIWHADKMERTLQRMKAAERQFGVATPLLVHSDLRVVDENLRCLAPSFWRYQFVDPRRTELHQLILQNCVTGCTMMLNRALFELGRPIPTEACVHDHWYALVASAFGHIAAISDPLIEYRQHGGNVTGAKKWGTPYVMNHARRLYAENGARQTIDRNILQARAFLACFEGRLDPAQRRAVANFAAIRGYGALGRRLSLVRNRFWKAGLVRNIGLLLAI
ncbi:MAG TPA: glycosyltransferase family 2 protein [Rhizomicrobium sp.]|jgi:glycosyltransferase involved in cell wall biosynthesis|nr:glycosyltransferase family 2 protein [Rhizomicrobium sp.]